MLGELLTSLVCAAAVLELALAAGWIFLFTQFLDIELPTLAVPFAALWHVLATCFGLLVVALVDPDFLRASPTFGLIIVGSTCGNPIAGLFVWIAYEGRIARRLTRVLADD